MKAGKNSDKTEVTGILPAEQKEAKTVEAVKQIHCEV